MGVQAVARASSVRSVVRITGNFSSESALHPAAKSALLAAFDQGWADPKKISQSAARAAILRNQAVETIASKLGIPSHAIEILGEPALGHYLGIAGLLDGDSAFAYAATDKGKIRAVARSHHGKVLELQVNPDGEIIYPADFQQPVVLSLQLANSETGVIQRNPQIAFSSISIDATTSGAQVPLPDKWDTALFDATSWAGPSGLGILAVNSAKYRYPIPHIAPIRAPGTYSLPLLIAAAVALENYSPIDPTLRNEVIHQFSKVPGVKIVAPDAPAIADKISMTVDGVAGEQLVRALSAIDIDVDTGSACSPADIQPSHVLAAMGYPTSGHIRITLHQGVTPADIASLKESFVRTLQELRG